MPYDPKAIANYLLDLKGAEGDSLTPMKLQKLVYFANGWYLALTDRPLITEPVQAWKYGPVIDSLYHAFRDFGNQPITRKASDVRAHPNTGEISRFDPSLEDEPAGEDRAIAMAIIDRIHEIYGKYDGLQLSDMTHREGTPWHRVRQMYPEGLPPRVKIPDNIIKEYFRAKLEPPVKA